VKLWCELAWLGGPVPEAGVVLELSHGVIANVTGGVQRPPSDSERLTGLVLPGLANAHSHAFQRALRGRTHAARGSFWTWRKQMYALAGALDPDTMFALSRATFAEMALAGMTLVGEFHYLHHAPGGAAYEDVNAMGASVIAAAREAGLRLTLIDACYLHGGIDPDPVQQRFFDASAGAWIERVEQLSTPPLVRLGAGIHSVRAVQPEQAAAVAAWADERSLPVHAHVSEQRAENEVCQEVYGATPTAMLHYEGVLSERFTAVHATHLSEADIALLGQAQVCCCLCPTTERDLADGIGPAAALRSAGASLALGSDSGAMIEPLEEARAVELDERLASGERGRHTGLELLKAATESGYASLGWPEGGAIRPGALADVVAIRTDGVRLAGVPGAQLVDGVVFAGSAADVTDVLVGGEFVVRDGRHVTVDVTGELAGSIASLDPTTPQAPT
jgi:formiminoglutamate deiminase